MSDHQQTPQSDPQSSGGIDSDQQQTPNSPVKLTPRSDPPVNDIDNDICEDEDEKNCDDEENLEWVNLYLSTKQYPPHTSKNDRNIIRRRAKSFQFDNGALNYIKTSKIS